MSRTKTVSVLIAVIGVGAAAAVVPGQSAARPPDVNLLVQGDVRALAPAAPRQTTSARRPVAAPGSQVRVSWIPGLADARAGDVLHPVTLAVTRTDGAGRYRVHVTPNRALQAAAAANGGWVSFDVSAATDELAQSVSVSRRLVHGTWAQASPRAAIAGDNAGARTVDAADTFGTLDDLDFTFERNQTAAATSPTSGATDGAGAWAPRTGPRRESNEVRFTSVSSPRLTGLTSTALPSRSAPTAGGSVPCSFVVTGTPQRSARVLRFHNAGNSNASWTYGTSADSDLDVAFDGSGDGTWSLRGSFHVGNSQGTSVHQSVRSAFNQYARTSFRFTEGTYKPFGLGDWCNNDPSIPVWSKRKTATRWVAGVGNDTGAGSGFRGCFVSPQNAHRRAYPPNTGLRKASSRASRIGVAADVGPINIGGSSGYSTQLDLAWNSVRGAGIYLCGTRDDVTGSPGVIHAQNR